MCVWVQYFYLVILFIQLCIEYNYWRVYRRSFRGLGAGGTGFGIIEEWEIKEVESGDGRW